MITFTRRIGRNRSRARLWIEGKHLTAAGLSHGTLWTLNQTEDGLTIQADPQGRRRIAGRADRPVIDIVGTSLGKLADAKVVSCSYQPDSGLITVTVASNG